jgi:hypothetical protein
LGDETSRKEAPPAGNGAAGRPGGGSSAWRLVALSVLLCFVFGFSPRFSIVEPTLDSGYRYEVSVAAAAGFTWGRDIVATYGPLGYVVYGAVDVGALLASLVVWQLVLVGATGVAIAAYARSLALGSARAEAALVAGLAYLFHLQAGGFSDEWNWFTLFVLAALLSIHASGRRALAASAAAGALAGFLLLAKSSTGVGALLTLAAAAPLHRGIRPAAAHVLVWSLTAAVVFTFGWRLESGSIEGVAAFLRTSGSLVQGFASAMSWTESGSALVVTGLVISFVSFATVAAAAYPSRPFRTIAACAVPFLLVWKQSVIRCDGLHVRPPAIFVVLVCGVVAIECFRCHVARLRVLPLAAVAAFMTVLWAAPGSGPIEPTLRAVVRPLTLPGPRAVWKKLLHFDDTRRDLAERSRVALRRSVLSGEQKAAIGGRAVDVYPWGVDLVAANRLQHRPRPMRASMAAYTPELVALDAEFYRGPRRPDVVLWNAAHGALGIDGRNSLWDEPHTFLEIVDRYRLISAGRVLVLELAENRRFAGRERGSTVTAPWGAWIDAPDSPGPWLAVVELHRPLTAGLRRALLREEPAFVSVRTPDRETTFRFAPDLAGQGLWMSPLPTTAAEVQGLFQGSFDVPTKAVRFSGAWGGGDAPPLTLTWWRLVPSQPR